VENGFQAIAIDEQRRPYRPTLWEVQQTGTQNLEQVWFVGAHNNIGGGYSDSRLSDISFLWMKEKAASCGLAFDAAQIQKVFKPNYAGKI